MQKCSPLLSRVHCDLLNPQIAIPALSILFPRDSVIYFLQSSIRSIRTERGLWMETSFDEFRRWKLVLEAWCFLYSGEIVLVVVLL